MIKKKMTACQRWKQRALIAEAKAATIRSKQWPSFKKRHLKTQPACQYCGSKEHVEVHHIVPFHVNPRLELKSANLITLCEVKGVDCHLKVGHLGNWKKANSNVIEECRLQQEKKKAKDADAK